MSAASLLRAQQDFTATLAAVDDAARFAFRPRLRPQEFEEARAEARAAAWSAWHGLIQRGKDPLALGVHGIANNAIRSVRNGRRLRHRSGGRAARDVFHPRARAAGGYRVISLDSGDEPSCDGSAGGPWRQWLAEDNRVSPADEACFRLDFQAWLEGLPARKRQAAELLAQEYQTDEVARIVGVSPGRVSQLRRELAASWRSFQDQAAADQHRAALTLG
jgi:hypothetical protein